MFIIAILKSANYNKKYTAFVKENPDSTSMTVIEFGSRNNTQYYDLLEHYKAQNNLNPVNLKNYYLRHKVNYPKFSADWFSKTFLWNKNYEEIVNNFPNVKDRIKFLCEN